MDIVESYAIQGLSASASQRDAVGYRGMGSIPERDLGTLLAVLAGFSKNP
jgi:hypothetical protein